MDPGPELAMEFSKNPLLCPICGDYYTEPCILGCYHTFCTRCLRGREQDRRLICPFCRAPTALKDGYSVPPPDTLMRQLIEIANSENPPCSNCDKRDRANMYYCNTCGQALCAACRDNTHRAKMFSQHDIIHMNRCQKEPKRCPTHGEQFIMYSPVQNAMLCVNCFRDTPTELRAQCVDIETAHTQAAKRLERGQNAIMDLQTSVRDGIIALKGLMDDLRRNMDAEKHTINAFCQGMQEAMAKTHAAMIMEVQRQYESKDRVYRSQLLVLGTVMPVLQLHLVLCTTFTSAANKYQFLELCPALIERLAAVGQLSQPVRSLQSSAVKTNYRSEFAQSLEPWIGATAVSQHQAELAAASTARAVYDAAPPPLTKKQQGAMKTKLLDADTSFSVHCRSFESQIRELNTQFNTVKDRVSELHKDVSAIRKAANPPLTTRYEVLTQDCQLLDASLERQQTELDRMAAVFDKSWEEQLWRLRVEQEVFSCQRADVMTLRNELKHLCNVAQQLEPYVRSLTPAATAAAATQQQQQASDQAAEQAQHLQNILEHIGRLQTETGKIPRSRSRIIGQLIEKVRPQPPDRERSKSTSQMEKSAATTPTSKSKKFAPQQLNIERLETHIKEKIHDIMCRRQSAASKSDGEATEKPQAASKEQSLFGGKHQRIMYKKIGKSCDKLNDCPKAAAGGGGGVSQCEYKRITADGTSKSVKAMVHETRSSPSSPKCRKGKHHGGGGGGGGQQGQQHPPMQRAASAGAQRKGKVYPYSDGEDNVFYSLHDSADSLSTSSRRSSYDGNDKTLVVVINRRNKGQTLAQKQRSWETFPPKRRHHASCAGKLSAPEPMSVRKADSFEGHEEAVKSLVAAVQETRRKPK